MFRHHYFSHHAKWIQQINSFLEVTDMVIYRVGPVASAACGDLCRQMMWVHVPCCRNLAQRVSSSPMYPPLYRREVALVAWSCTTSVYRAWGSSCGIFCELVDLG